MGNGGQVRRTTSPAFEVTLIGCNHRTAPVELRERVAFTPEQALRAADELRRSGIVEEAVVLSTCNRSELYGVTVAAGGRGVSAMENFFADFHQLASADLNGRTYRECGSEAVRHLYRVASGLDSMMLGEAEILGQVRDAYNRAFEHGTTGSVLNRLFQSALEVGKRVRAETEVGTRPMSVALAGVKLAEQVFGKLANHEALIVGAGAMAEQVVDQLRNRGVGRLRIVNRTREHAEDLSGRSSGEVIEWAALEAALASPDVIVTSVGGGETVLTRGLLERALGQRSGRPMFIVDLGVPRNVEPDARRLYNLYLYNVDDLGEIVEQNRKAREAEIPRVEAIIAEHVGKFENWKNRVEAISLAEQLRTRFEDERKRLLEERRDSMGHLSAADLREVEKITEELFARLIQKPAERLRRSHDFRKRIAGIEALREFFGLDGDEP